MGPAAVFRTAVTARVCNPNHEREWLMRYAVKCWLFHHSFLLLLLVVGLGIVLSVGIVWWLVQGGKEAEGAWRAMLVVGGTILSFCYFLQKQHLEETRLMKELITDFNKRYDALNGPLHKILEKKGQEPKICSDERATIVDYFNLCAEEYLFYRLGYVEPCVWKAWDKGMREYAKDPRIQKVWEEEQSGSYYGFEFPTADS